MTLDEIENAFLLLWRKNWSDKIVVVRDKTPTDYLNMGVKFLSNFYHQYAPFDQMEILGLETNDKYLLSDGNDYSIRIDKIGKDTSGTFFVCDYKTNNKLKSEEELATDRQLAMYSLWVRKKFGAKSVKLIWHFLAHKQDIIIEKSESDLLEVEKEVVGFIAQIRAAKTFEPTVTKLCDWCVYKSICPMWNKEPQKKLGQFF
jgi:CRISPR/Cas system-associated exonuclease Cas4 (RecB family)